MKVTHYSSTGEKGSLTLNKDVFGGEANLTVLSQAIRVYRSNLRQGTSKTKTRAEVNRTRKKWFKQKGTGNARHGARTPNIFVGGGVSHGPNGEQNWSLNLPTRLKRLALKSALLAQASNVSVHDGLSKVAGKTAPTVKMLDKAGLNADRVLVIIAGTQLSVVQALRNVDSVLVTSAERVTALDVAGAHQVVLSPEAVSILEARLQADKTAQPKVAKVVAAEPKKAAAAKPAAKKAVAKKPVSKEAKASK